VSGSADGGQRRLRFYERLLINRCPFDQVNEEVLSVDKIDRITKMDRMHNRADLYAPSMLSAMSTPRLVRTCGIGPIDRR